MTKISSILSDVQLEGFVHSLSPVKHAKKKNRKPYFDCLVQTGEDEKVRAVCYDPQLRKNLLEPYQNKSPIKITATKRMASTSTSEEFRMTKKSKITSAAPEFSYNSQVVSSIVMVQEALSAPEYKAVDIVAKVVTKNHENQLIIKQGQQLKKSDCIIGDEHSTIKLTLWEDLIDRVECGKTYTFKNVRIRVFDNVKYLSTNTSTSIEPADRQIHDINLTSEQFAENIIEGRFIGANVKAANSCVVCNTTLNQDDSEDDMITCPLPTCQTTMLFSECQTKLVCNLTVKKTDGKMQMYTCFNDGLQSFLISINKGDTRIDDLSPKELNKLFLTAGTKQLIVDNSTSVIHQVLF
ncbi:uncharacterized protein LOC116605201 isoform X2 [Nematostella vectensis]|uniref:uncharacterized protein LOC116605201 isoform X2 n=1 Tax=Nematostella vectensis TaxID=45351 RepID=UPI0020771AA1|nr:uncharacterized protein LOC116605201 isoform X2 [Nematostella vectensis]